MNKKALGSAVLFVSIAGAIGAYLHVRPHSQQAQVLGGRYDALRDQSQGTCGQIRDAVTAETLRAAVVTCRRLTTDSMTLSDEQKAFVSDDTAVRRLFVSLPFSQQDLNRLQSSNSEALRGAPATAQSVLGREVAVADGSLRQATGSAGVQAQLQRVQQAVTALIEAVSEAVGEGEARSATSALLQSAGRLMSSFSAATLARLESVRAASRSSALAKLDGSASASEVQAVLAGWLNELKMARIVLGGAAAMGGPSPEVQNLDRRLDADHSTLDGSLKAMGLALDARRAANEQVAAALVQMDHANELLSRLERNATWRDIDEVHKAWMNAVGSLSTAQQALAPRGTLEVPARAAWTACNRLADEKVTAILGQAEAHRALVGERLTVALNEESNVEGFVARSARRGMDRIGRFFGAVVEKAQDTRIGREVGVAVKGLVLGTHAFYQLQDPNADVLAWAMSNSGDMELLLSESEEISRMPGPSLTGKNTLIERWVGDAHQKAFRQKD